MSPAVFFMGSAFPLMCQVLEKEYQSSATIARQFAYGINAGGATLGCLLTGLVGMPFLGIKASWILCLSGNLIAALICFQLHRQLPTGASPAEKPVPVPDQKQETAIPSPAAALSHKRTLLAAFATGASVALMELCWSRLLSQFFGSSLLCWIFLLSTCIVAVVLGTRLAALLNQVFLPFRLAMFFSLFLFASWLALATIPAWIDLIILLTPQKPDNIPALISYLLPLLIICLFSILPSFSFISAIFPSLLSKEGNSTSANLYAINCIGAFLAGALTILMVANIATPGKSIFILLLKSNCYLQCLIFLFVLYPLLSKNAGKTFNQKQSFFAAAIICLLFAAAIQFVNEDRIVLTLASAFGLSSREERLFYKQQEQKKWWSSVVPRGLLFYKDGICSTVSKLFNERTNTLSLVTDGKVDGSQPADLLRRNDYTDLPTQKLLAALPLIAHQGSLRKVLNIGLGTGTTCNTILAFSEVRHLSVSEVETCVIEAATGPAVNPLPSNSPIRFPGNATQNFPYSSASRLQIIKQDCRFLLHTTSKHYDVIISQPSEPWTRGSCDLYSREFFQLLKQHLAPNGIFCQWLQVYAIDEPSFFKILATLKSVFPQIVICQAPGARELVLLCIAEQEPFRFNLDRVQTRLQDPSLQAALYPCNLSSPSQLLNCIRLAPPDVDNWLQAHRIPVLSSDDSLDLEARLTRFIINPDTGNELIDRLTGTTSSLDNWLSPLPLARKCRFSADLALAEACALTEYQNSGKTPLSAQLRKNYNIAMTGKNDPYTTMRLSQLNQLLKNRLDNSKANSREKTSPDKTAENNTNNTLAIMPEIYYLWCKRQPALCLQRLNQQEARVRQNPELLNLKGWLLLQRESWQEAQQCFISALQIKPVFPAALLGAACCSRQLNLTGDSLLLAEQALRLQPNDGGTKIFFTSLLAREKQKQEDQNKYSPSGTFIQELIEQKIAQSFCPW